MTRLFLLAAIALVGTAMFEIGVDFWKAIR